MEDSERKKAIELLKEMRRENNVVGDKSDNQETHLNWMYKGPSDLIDREEYLLGKAIDKHFEVLNSGGSSDIGKTGEQSNVPKRVLEKTDSLEQVDIAKKILEDPLYAIKQKEMEARKKLLNNPVKLKQIKQMLLERSKQNSFHKLKRKKTQKSEQDLNFLILKKLEKLTEKEKRKAFNKILKSGSDSDSASSSNNKKDIKHKLEKKRSYSSSHEYDSSSESSSSSSSSSSEKFFKKKRKKSKIYKKKQNRRKEELSCSSSSSDYERNKKSKNKTLSIKHYSKTFNLENKSSAIYKKVRKSRYRSLRTSKDSLIKNKKSDLREENTRNQQSKKMYKGKRERNKDQRNSFSDEESRFKKNYGLMIPDGSDPEKRKREFHVQKEQKTVESKKKYVPPAKVKPLSDKEKEEKLKEMMENAKLRKEDREKNLANHRKKQAQEEESKIYDDDFMRRQMSHLTSRGTMADRIRSNINNIQRSKSSMDISFMRK